MRHRVFYQIILETHNFLLRWENDTIHGIFVTGAVVQSYLNRVLSMCVNLIYQSAMWSYTTHNSHRASKHKPIITAWEHPSLTSSPLPGEEEQGQKCQKCQKCHTCNKIDIIWGNASVLVPFCSIIPRGETCQIWDRLGTSKTLAQIALDKIMPYGDIYANQLGTWTCTDMIYRMVPLSSRI